MHVHSSLLKLMVKVIVEGGVAVAACSLKSSECLVEHKSMVTGVFNI